MTHPSVVRAREVSGRSLTTQLQLLVHECTWWSDGVVVVVSLYLLVFSNFRIDLVIK